LLKKIALIDTLVPTILAIEKEFHDRIKLLSSLGNPDLGKEYLTINPKSAVQTLQSKLDLMYQKLTDETLDKFPIKTSGKVNNKNFQERLEYWRKKLIFQIINGISNGNYAALISTLPNEFYLNAHIPNTFLCAFTFVTQNGNKINIFVDNSKPSHTLSPKSIFISGITDSDYSGSSLLLQTTALGGIIPTGKTRNVSGPQDLYRHSEQIAFHAMEMQDFINGIVSYIKKIINPEDNVMEIIFHGHTFRDMCPNCRATLIGHIISTTKKNLYPMETFAVNSFLCLLQNKCLEQFGNLPVITSVISSFLPYAPRTSVNGWDQTPPIDLLDPTKLAPEGICPKFVNQFAFSEAEFLSGMIKNLQQVSQPELGNIIISKLEERLTAITSVTSLSSEHTSVLDKEE